MNGTGVSRDAHKAVESLLQDTGIKSQLVKPYEYKTRYHWRCISFYREIELSISKSNKYDPSDGGVYIQRYPLCCWVWPHLTRFCLACVWLRTEECYQKAIALGDMDAHVNMAKCLMTGEGVEANSAEAQRLLMVSWSFSNQWLSWTWTTNHVLWHTLMDETHLHGHDSQPWTTMIWKHNSMLISVSH